MNYLLIAMFIVFGGISLYTLTISRMIHNTEKKIAELNKITSSVR